jgi:hypothetical protein
MLHCRQGVGFAEEEKKHLKLFARFEWLDNAVSLHSTRQDNGKRYMNPP